MDDAAVEVLVTGVDLVKNEPFSICVHCGKQIYMYTSPQGDSHWFHTYRQDKSGMGYGFCNEPGYMPGHTSAAPTMVDSSEKVDLEYG